MTPAGTCEEGVANEDAPRSVLEEEFEKGAGEELEDLASVALLAIEWADEDEELDSVPLARGCDRGADADEEVDWCHWQGRAKGWTRTRQSIPCRRQGSVTQGRTRKNKKSPFPIQPENNE